MVRKRNLSMRFVQIKARLAHQSEVARKPANWRGVEKVGFQVLSLKPGIRGLLRGLESAAKAIT